MKLSEVVYPDAPPIDGYGPGFFRVGGEARRGAVMLLPDGSVLGWDGSGIAPLIEAAASVDVVIHGTGDEMAHAPAALREAVEGAGMGLEVMATPAACRTYNVLLGEGRRIAALLRPVGDSQPAA